ncbi:MAG TPA: universal stress protein, partial [Ktedonobacteraceae bacterium]|nr:universal stress protein [Ktedonobacteraceae bacterium]
MLNKILVPLDESLRAERALPVAARIARASKGSIVLAEVISPAVDYASSLAPVPLVSAEIVDAEQKEAEGYLKAQAASPMLSGIETRTQVLYGFPAQEILALAKEQSIDLIVLCSHGRTGFTRWVLGSVAQKLTHESAVPVLVLRDGGPELASPQPETCGRLTRAFVSLDGSRLSEAVLQPATELALALSAPAPAALHLMQVVQVFPQSEARGRLSELNQQALEQAKAYLADVKARLQQQFPESFLAITTSVGLDNDIAAALIRTAEAREEGTDAAEAKGCDLIAMSTHGRGGLERRMVGSVTERVLETTRLPMLVVRPSLTKREAEGRKLQRGDTAGPKQKG